MTLEHHTTPGVDLDLPHRLADPGPLQPELQAAYTGEKGAYSHDPTRRTYHSGKPEIQAPRSSLAYAVNSSWRISSQHSSITSRWTSRMMRPMSLLAASGPILPASLRWAIAFSQRASEQYLRPRSTTALSRGARGGRLCMISWKRGATNLPLSPN